MPRKKYIEDYYDVESMLKAQEERSKRKNKKPNYEVGKKIFAVVSVAMLFLTSGFFYIISEVENGAVATSSGGIIGRTLEPELVQASQRKASTSLEKSNEVIEDEIIDNKSFIESQVQIYDNEDIKMYMYIVNKSGEVNFGEPVAQNPSNRFYLDHNLFKQVDKKGAIFLDYSIDLTETAKNVVVYGSNQFENENLYNLRKYSDKSFYDANKIIKVALEDRNVYYEVFAFCEVSDTFRKEPTEFATDKAFESYISEIKSSAKYFDKVASDDNIITICTASNNADGIRYKVYAKRVNMIE